jgi:hypothetical protein
LFGRLVLTSRGAGQGICDLVLGLAGDQTCLVACLDEATGRLRATRGEQGGLEGLASRACVPVLGEAGEVPPVAVAMSLSPKLTETQVDAMAVNGVLWGARLVLTAVLSHFPKLEVELDLPGSSYNADLSSDEMETLWT